MVQAEFERATALLLEDVAHTLGEQHQAAVLARAAELREADLATPEKLVEDVQQYFHDACVDTVWPACPRHGQHPLWFRAGVWWCEAEQTPVVPLGRLAARGRR